MSIWQPLPQPIYIVNRVEIDIESLPAGLTIEEVEYTVDDFYFGTSIKLSNFLIHNTTREPLIYLMDYDDVFHEKIKDYSFINYKELEGQVGDDSKKVLHEILNIEVNRLAADEIEKTLNNKNDEITKLEGGVVYGIKTMIDDLMHEVRMSEKYGHKVLDDPAKNCARHPEKIVCTTKKVIAGKAYHYIHRTLDFYNPNIPEEELFVMSEKLGGFVMQARGEWRRQEARYDLTAALSLTKDHLPFSFDVMTLLRDGDINPAQTGLVSCFDNYDIGQKKYIDPLPQPFVINALYDGRKIGITGKVHYKINPDYQGDDDTLHDPQKAKFSHRHCIHPFS